MKPVALILLMLLSLPSFADELLSRRLISTRARTEALPKDLHFAADRITVLNTGWYESLFNKGTCQTSLTSAELETTLEVFATGQNSLSLSLDGMPAKLIEDAKSFYIPVHYVHGQPVHPHFLIRLKDWVVLHVSIHKTWTGAKDLKLSLVQGKGDNVHLVPILEAKGQ